ncbi:MAG: sulfatase, partial [Lewinella sp.]|nr:sulfatase [Lewinella sp.]
MQNRYRLFWIGIGITALLACRQQEPETVTQPPNVLWILAEDLSQDLACYGYPGVLTPHVDALAADGMRFTRVFTTAPACTPSRTALACGMYQNSINAHHMRYPDELMTALPDGILPINELFRRQGYITANIKDSHGTGKTDWSFRSPVAGFDVQHWDSLSQDKPFFAVVNLRLTHRPFEQDTLHPVDPATVKVPPYYPDHAVAREDFAQYLETAQLMDQQVGEILTELENRGLRDNTIIVFFSDHGRPMSRAKYFLYDSGIQIPLIIQAPEKLSWRKYLPAGSVNDDLISAIDISATSLAFAGLDRQEWMQGRVILGPHPDDKRTAVFSVADRFGETHLKSRAVRTAQWKYIRNYIHNISVNEGATAYRKANHPIYHLLNIYNEKSLLTPEQKALVMPLPEEELYN